MDIIRGGIILIMYTFVMIVIYLVISGVFDDFVTSFEDVNLTNSDAEIEQSGGVIRTVFNMSFAGLVIIPILWFIYFAFYREPDWRFRQ